VTATAEEEILRLLFTYTDAFDRGDMRTVDDLLRHATLYAERGVVTTSAEVTASFERHAIRYDGDPRTMHVCTNIIVEIDEDAGLATARSVFIPHQEAAGYPLQAYTAGRYHDRFERVDGRWRFAERTYLVTLVGDMTAHYRADVS
jgi:hypothetical protein